MSDTRGSSEASALEAFVAGHGPALQRFAWLLTRDPHRAADLTQTVLLRLARRGIADLADPATYARRAVLNEHRSQARRTATRVRYQHLVGDDDAAAPPPDLSERDAIWRSLARLTDRQRAAVVLRYYEDLADEQIAEVLGCRRTTVRSLIARAMPILRADLTATEDPDRTEGERR